MMANRRSSSKDKFTENERLAILAEYEAAGPGQKQAVCRRYDVTSQSVQRWRRDQRDGLLKSSDNKHRAHLMNKRERAAYERVLRENEALKAKLARSESAVDALGKASELLVSLARSSRIEAPETQDPWEVPQPPETFRAQQKQPENPQPLRAGDSENVPGRSGTD